MGVCPVESGTSEGRRLIAGAMSGTSADGVDVALVRVNGHGTGMTARLLRHHHVAFDPGLRESLFCMRDSGSVELAVLARVGRDVSMVYARAVNEVLAASGVEARDLSAVAAHGQTLYHAPPCTIQWLDPSLLAAEVGCAVVSDFRRADCAAGGQGAPLVPFADYVLFRDPHKTRVLLNIGGIANLTHLPAGAPIERLTAFDTGPGNCVCDHLVRTHNPGGRGYDEGGTIAGRGVAIRPLVQQALSDSYFAQAPPKSTDGPAMIDVFRRALAVYGQNQPLENLMRSACLLTATTIADAVRRPEPFPDELVISGGGTRNATLMALLQQPLADIPVRTTDELGVPSESKEAIAFALLGAATLDGVPSNVPAATGARWPVVLGSITPKP